MATMVPDEENKEVEHLWELLDVNHDGLVTLDEMNEMLPALPDNMASWLQRVDIEDKGGLTYSEFQSALLEGDVLASTQNCKEAFHVFSDDNGTINAHSLAQSLGMDDEEACDFMIKDAGGAGGRLDFETFFNFIQKYSTEETPA